MNLRKLLLTKNDCYKANGKLMPKGIMVHSTGANNPYLRRYVQPDDGQLGKNTLDNHFNVPRPSGRKVCVHAFIGKLQDGSIATYQTLPWDMRGWHAGGSANNTHIGFEICEDALTDAAYLNAVYRDAVELCAYLCKLYNLTEQNIIGHYEGYQQGIASNHGDPKHWFSRYGKSMDTFRADVKKELEKGGSYPLFERTLKHGLEGTDVGQAQRILKALGYYSGEIDNRFGPGTGFLKAVKKFQADNNLETDGNIGPKTQAVMLEAVLKAIEQQKEDPEKIKLLQEALDFQRKELDSQKVTIGILQSQVSKLEAELTDYKQYFKLQEQLRKGV